MPETKNMFKAALVTKLNRDTASLKQKAVAAILELPSESERQIDLQYLTAIFVSSGMNKNGAVFLGSELLKAQDTITTKAVDLEHDEQAVVGHITNRAFVSRTGEVIDAKEVAKEKSAADVDKLDMDIAIAAVIYKDRFLEIATEIEEGKWMVSMECYYRDYDVMVGDLILPRPQAEELGYDKLVGKVVNLKRGGKDLGFHAVGRVLRDIVFSGVGLVKNPANERSVIMEAAAYTRFLADGSKEAAAVIDLDNLDSVNIPDTSDAAANTNLTNAVTAGVLAAFEKAYTTGLLPGKSRPGTCVSFKKYVYDIPTAEDDTMPTPQTDLTQYPLANHPGDIDTIEPSAKIIHENWCELFDLECSARPGDATHPECWRNVFARAVEEEVVSYYDLLRQKRLSVGLVELENLLEDAKELASKKNNKNPKRSR